MKKRTIWGVCIVATLLFTAFLGAFAYSITYHKPELPTSSDNSDCVIFIDNDDTSDSVKTKSNLGWRFDFYKKVMPFRVRTGRYTAENGITSLSLYRKFRNGTQSPTELIIPSVRTVTQLADAIGKQLMLSAEEIRAAFTDSIFCSSYSFTPETFPSLFIPNTYQVYWNTSLEALMKRMVKEHNAFWNAERMQKAKNLNLTPEQVSTQASTLDEESSNNAEKPTIAGMYINRIRKGMLLQADPTVKFALGDFTLRRIYYKHLEVDSPYNTYRYVGLPPGPIRIPSIAALDAVLNYKESSYLYMCAKEDFSGTHNFATTLAEHMRNARKYARALNERGIR